MAATKPDRDSYKVIDAEIWHAWGFLIEARAASRHSPNAATTSVEQTAQAELDALLEQRHAVRSQGVPA